MAFLSDVIHQTEAAGLPSLRGLTARLRAFREHRRTRERLFRELSAYTDRDLADLGFTRGDIWSVANGTYRR